VLATMAPPNPSIAMYSVMLSSPLIKNSSLTRLTDCANALAMHKKSPSD